MLNNIGEGPREHKDLKKAEDDVRVEIKMKMGIIYRGSSELV